MALGFPVKVDARYILDNKFGAKVRVYINKGIVIQGFVAVSYIDMQGVFFWCDAT